MPRGRTHDALPPSAVGGTRTPRGATARAPATTPGPSRPTLVPSRPPPACGRPPTGRRESGKEMERRGGTGGRRGRPRTRHPRSPPTPPSLETDRKWMGVKWREVKERGGAKGRRERREEGWEKVREGRSTRRSRKRAARCLASPSTDEASSLGASVSPPAAPQPHSAMSLSPVSAHQAPSLSPLLVGPEGPLAAVLSRVDRLDGVLVRRVSSRLAGDAAAIAVKTEAAPQLALWVVDDRLLAGDDFSALESFVVEVEGRVRALSTSRCFLGVPAHLRLTARLSLRFVPPLSRRPRSFPSPCSIVPCPFHVHRLRRGSPPLCLAGSASTHAGSRSRCLHRSSSPSATRSSSSAAFSPRAPLCSTEWSPRAPRASIRWVVSTLDLVRWSAGDESPSTHGVLLPDAVPCTRRARGRVGAAGPATPPSSTRTRPPPPPRAPGCVRRRHPTEPVPPSVLPSLSCSFPTHPALVMARLSPPGSLRAIATASESSLRAALGPEDAAAAAAVAAWFRDESLVEP